MKEQKRTGPGLMVTVWIGGTFLLDHHLRGTGGRDVKYCAAKGHPLCSEGRKVSVQFPEILGGPERDCDSSLEPSACGARGIRQGTSHAGVPLLHGPEPNTLPKQ